MSIFINYNKITNTYHTNISRPIYDFLNFQFVTEQDYCDWVHQWKAYEKELVSAIRFFRKLKNELKYADNKEKDERKLNNYWQSKQYLGSIANDFYQKRVENKKKFKEKLTDPNFQRINKNTYEREIKNVA